MKTCTAGFMKKNRNRLDLAMTWFGGTMLGVAIVIAAIRHGRREAKERIPNASIF